MIIEKPFRILAIDGGGIKGLFAAEIIKGFEDHFGSPMHEYFDMISGTSTGGLIALSLSLGIPATEIVGFYKNDGLKIFPYKTKLGRGLAFGRQLFWGAKYSNVALSKALKSTFKENEMQHAKCLLCIPAYNLTLGRPKIFKSPLYINGKNLWTTDASIKMQDVALATSAAPTYFPIHQIGGELFTDGGVWCNNPSLSAYIEASKYVYNKTFDIGGQEIKYTSIELLSISSINQPISWSTKRKKDRAAWRWLLNNQLLPPFMEGQSNFADYTLKSLQESGPIPLKYKRITHAALSAEHMKSIDMDKATRSSLDCISNLGIDQVRFYKSTQKQEIEHFFTPKTFKQ